MPCGRDDGGPITTLAPVLVAMKSVAFLAAGLWACAAVEVPGYQDKYPPLPGTERYTPESLIRNFEHVFDDEILEAIHKELMPLDSLAKGSGALRNSKRVTFWIGGDREPRCAVERAVKILEEVSRDHAALACHAAAAAAAAAAPAAAAAASIA